MFLNAQNIPETLLLSPIFMSIPYFSGIVISYCHMSTSPLKTVHKTPSAPFNSSIRSVVAAILHSRHAIFSTTFSTIFLILARFSGLMSISAKSHNKNAEKASKSPHATARKIKATRTYKSYLSFFTAIDCLVNLYVYFSTTSSKN